MAKQPGESGRRTLLCEQFWVYALLMIVGGYYGRYTYSVRGGVFCNAQTANFVLLSLALGHAQWRQALYYIIPITAYLMGSVVSEQLPPTLRRLGVRWETVQVLLEAAVVLLLGLLPDSAPHPIAQVSINFVCSMRYNTFRSTRGISMATTFCTNHVRQTGIALVGARRCPENPFYLRKLLTHLPMLALFVVGGVAATVLSGRLAGRAIWAVLAILIFLFLRLLHADLFIERDLRDQTPAGH